MGRYRNERDALRHRADHLQDELRHAEARLSEAEQRLVEQARKDEEEEKQLAYLRSEVERLRVKTGEAPVAPAQGPSRTPLVVGLGAVAVAVGGALMWLTFSSSEPVVVGPQAVAQTEPAVAPVPAAEPQVALFGAEVVATTGASQVEVGEPCLISATVAGGGTVTDLQVRCREEIYRSDTKRGEGAESYKVNHAEVKAGEGVYRHKLFYGRRGSWTGPRPQIALNSYQHRATIWREGADAWSVTLHLDAFSFPRRGPALGAGRSLSAVPDRRWSARRVGFEGTPPRLWREAPETCEVAVSPTPSGQSSDGTKIDCRVTVRCGAVIFYGEGDYGFIRCPLEGAKLGTVVDDGSTEKNGDPELRIEPAQRKVVVTDTIDAATFSATFALEPPSDCLPALSWKGSVFTPTQREAYRLERVGNGAELGLEGEPPLEVALPERCAGGTLPLQTEGAPLLVFGPGRRTLGGFTAEGRTLALRGLKLSPSSPRR